MSKRQESILQFVSNPKRFVPIYTSMTVIASYRGLFSRDHDVSRQESSATSREQEAPIQVIDAAGLAIISNDEHSL